LILAVNASSVGSLTFKATSILRTSPLGFALLNAAIGHIIQQFTLAAIFFIQYNIGCLKK
jgi:hypothetical protein